ncbi:hypothetical protein C7446_1837 [Kushneria sinocarnis]|uniref:DUF5666 domain-containing protein n=1 Tax=Kushneria sinocarnis TaxID=595502 RepID=A0A420WW13_9GAMM|nr:hypothetical protein [Kushneria sinocarnis]RKR03316.1 hypothetical protein C7446_1837 [Kushneria sinocarnis]
MTGTAFRTTLLASAVALAGALSAGTALAADDQAQTPSNLRGTITEISDDGFTVRSNQNGETHRIAVSDSTRFSAVRRASLDEISEGTFIGTANVPGNDGQASRALEMVIFPESMKGTGLGNYPWDMPRGASAGSNAGDRLGGAGSSSTMTNGTVTGSEDGEKLGGAGGNSSMTNGTVTDTGGSKKLGGASGGSTMTNGTVSGTDSSNGTMTLTVDYGDGSKQIRVPRNVPTVKAQQATMEDLSTGQAVFVAGDMNQSPIPAKVVIVGLDGTVPPM